jgi:TonB family protein
MRCPFFVGCLLLILSSCAPLHAAQRVPTVSVLDFGLSTIGKLTADQLRTKLKSNFKLVISDPELSSAAARGIGYSGSLNLTVTEARDLGAAMASDFFVIGDAQTLRRSSSQRTTYFEAYCSIFLVSSRSGRLMWWDRPSFESDQATAAQEQLSQYLAGDEVSRFFKALQQAHETEQQQRAKPIEANGPLIEEAPDDEKAAEVQGLRLPRPYRRLRPDYPDTAARADAEGTVDVSVDVAADGEVSQVEVVRWAGFGLDEATVANVRRMHFFPAMKNGTAIPLRVLLRYNFRKPPR